MAKRCLGEPERKGVARPGRRCQGRRCREGGRWYGALGYCRKKRETHDSPQKGLAGKKRDDDPINIFRKKTPLFNKRGTSCQGKGRTEEQRKTAGRHVPGGVALFHDYGELLNTKNGGEEEGKKKKRKNCVIFGDAAVAFSREEGLPSLQLGQRR